MKVLVVDDSEDMRALLRLSLASHTTFDVVGEAGDGAEALGLIESLLPDVVVMDVDMPGMGGIAATEQVRSLYPWVRVLAFTGTSDLTMIDRMMEAGACGYVLKENLPDQLVYRLTTVS